MRCEQCGETMRPETVIRLRRSFGRVRATHEASAWCANCGTSASLETQVPPPPRTPLMSWTRQALAAAAVSRGIGP